MRHIIKPFTEKEIGEIRKTYGTYIKVTVDIEKNELVAGCELHADGEELLLRNGSKQNNIWGGGIDLNKKEIDTIAVLNLRPRLENNSMEILDPKRRNLFVRVVRKFFGSLWKN